MKDGENIVAKGKAAEKVIDKFAEEMPGDMPRFAPDMWLNPEDAVANTPDFSMLNAAVKAAELEKKMTVGSNLPTVGLGAGWFFHNLLDQNQNFGSVYIAVDIPLSGWWGGSHAIKRKNLEIQNARIQLEDGRQMLQIAMRDAEYLKSTGRLTAAD